MSSWAKKMYNYIKENNLASEYYEIDWGYYTPDEPILYEPHEINIQYKYLKSEKIENYINLYKIIDMESFYSIEYLRNKKIDQILKYKLKL